VRGSNHFINTTLALLRQRGIRLHDLPQHRWLLREVWPLVRLDRLKQAAVCLADVAEGRLRPGRGADTRPELCVRLGGGVYRAGALEGELARLEARRQRPRPAEVEDYSVLIVELHHQQPLLYLGWVLAPEREEGGITRGHGRVFAGLAEIGRALAGKPSLPIAVGNLQYPLPWRPLSVARARLQAWREEAARLGDDGDVDEAWRRIDAATDEARRLAGHGPDCDVLLQAVRIGVRTPPGQPASAAAG
jgi:hypothetical protein